MLLMNAQTQWGNLYRSRWYLDGRRVSKSYADYLLNSHAWERDGNRHGNGVYRYLYNIGPRDDAPSLMDHADCM